MSKCHIKVALYSMFLMALMIIFMHRYMSVLEKKIVEDYNITYWHISHFTYYFILGLLCPNNYCLFMLMGVLWELIERVYGKMIGQEDYWTSNGLTGQITDIIMNATGYSLAVITFGN